MSVLGADVTEGPSFLGSSGMGVHVFAGGGALLTLEAPSGQKRDRSSIPLTPAQLTDLVGFASLIAAANRPQSILDEARAIVHGDREQTHGAPDHNLRAIGGIWTALLRDQLKPGAAVSPQMVCLLMAGLKLARASHRPSHREHPLDVVGYMALLERCGWIDPK